MTTKPTDKPRVSLVQDYFGRSIMAIAENLAKGLEKHGRKPGDFLTVPDGFKVYCDAHDRHRLQEAMRTFDPEDGIRELVKTVTNDFIRLEILLREQGDEQNMTLQVWVDTITKEDATPVKPE